MSNISLYQTISKTVAKKKDTILTNWRDRNRENSKIPSSKSLSDSEIENSIGNLLEALATALSESKDDDYGKIARESLHHGRYRALQGFRVDEIAREYRILRDEICQELESELNQISSQETTRAFFIINNVIDEAIGQCFSAYVEKQSDEAKKVKEELLLNNQELERLCQENRDRLGELVHELKTPLNSIMGLLQLIPQNELDFVPKGGILRISDLIQRVLRSSRILLQIINDSLELSKREGDRSELNPTKIELIPFIDYCIEVIEPLAEEKGLIVEKNYTNPPKEVICDPISLRQILMNLLSNAVRYTEKGQIKIESSTLTATEYCIIISDTGIGISPEKQTEIFEPFYRTQRAKKQAGGTGLGLAIVARQIELLGGKIELDSQIGNGSKFTIILPQELQLDLES